MALDLSNWISEIRTSQDWGKIAPRLGPMFQQLQDSINQGFSAVGVDATNTRQTPNPPASLSVQASSNGELAHVAISDNSDRSRALSYFLEHSTSPNFSPTATYTTHLGAARQHMLTLPTQDANGNTQSYYFRAYSMEPGSEKASAHVYYGQQLAPTAVQMNGSTKLTLLPSTGAGTAPTNGGKAGQGFGTVQTFKAGVTTKS